MTQVQVPCMASATSLFSRQTVNMDPIARMYSISVLNTGLLVLNGGRNVRMRGKNLFAAKNEEKNSVNAGLLYVITTRL